MRCSCSTGLAAAALAVGIATAPAAFAGEPVAIVEDVAAPATKLQFMDYVEAGRKIDLGASGHIVLGYLKSCLREDITGGTVVTGREQSQATGGKIRRERVECDGGNLNLTTAQAGKSGVVAFRKPPGAGSSMPAAAFKVYSVRPVIKVSGSAATVRLERLDGSDAPVELKLTRGIADMAAGARKLSPGGLYRATAGKASVVFRVDAFAGDGGPAIGRLVHL